MKKFELDALNIAAPSIGFMLMDGKIISGGWELGIIGSKYYLTHDSWLDKEKELYDTFELLLVEFKYIEKIITMAKSCPKHLDISYPIEDDVL